MSRKAMSLGSSLKSHRKDRWGLCQKILFACNGEGAFFYFLKTDNQKRLCLLAHTWLIEEGLSSYSGIH